MNTYFFGLNADILEPPPLLEQQPSCVSCANKDKKKKKTLR